MDRKFLALVVAGAFGAAAAVGVMEAVSRYASMPLVLIPFATSIVLVMGSPDAPPAQPRALIGGHLVSTIVGLVIVKTVGPGPWVAAFAVGASIVAMHLTRTFHPPAGIDPLIVVLNDLPWTFLLMPVAAGALALALFAHAWHRAARMFVQRAAPVRTERAPPP